MNVLRLYHNVCCSEKSNDGYQRQMRLGEYAFDIRHDLAGLKAY